MIKTLPVFIIVFLLAGCKEEQSAPLISNSPNGHIKLTISGKRDSPFSPWSTILLAEGKGLKGNINFEFYGSEISDKTISFVWDKDQTCTITFTEKDKTQRIFEFTPDGTDAMWKDLSRK